jgi:hypothetical protein
MLEAQRNQFTSTQPMQQAYCRVESTSAQNINHTPPGSNGTAKCYGTINLLAGYVYLHTSLPCTGIFTLDINAQDTQHDTDFDPDMLTNEGIFTG